jgi:hypothetical protein
LKCSFTGGYYPGQRRTPQKKQIPAARKAHGRDWKNEAACKNCWQNSIQYELLKATVGPTEKCVAFVLGLEGFALKRCRLLFAQNKTRQKLTVFTRKLSICMDAAEWARRTDGAGNRVKDEIEAF